MEIEIRTEHTYYPGTKGNNIYNIKTGNFISGEPPTAPEVVINSMSVIHPVTQEEITMPLHVFHFFLDAMGEEIENEIIKENE